MLRKLVIIGSIAALFVLTAAPAFGLSVLTGPPGDQTAKTVLDVGTLGESSPAHGPACGAELFGAIECDKGVSHNDTPAATNAPIPHEVNNLTEAEIDFNVGAWNAVFGPGGMSNPNSAICGVTDGDPAGAFDADNTCQD